MSIIKAPLNTYQSKNIKELKYKKFLIIIIINFDITSAFLYMTSLFIEDIIRSGDINNGPKKVEYFFFTSAVRKYLTQI